MMEHGIKGNPDARRRRRRIGRGNASGRGTYAGKGLKGQKARSGKGPRPGFEGGQLPLIKRLPEKRGFTNIFRKEYALVNVGALDSYTGEGPITREVLLGMGCLRNLKFPLKVLGGGELTRPVTVQAHKFSESARKKIEAAGGTVEEIQQ